MSIKKCSICFIEKPFTDFNKNSNNKDGLLYKCKSCMKEYRLTRVDKIRETNKKQRENSDYMKNYRIVKKEELSQMGKEWYWKNREKKLQYHQDNKEIRNQKEKERRRANPDKQKDYYQKTKYIRLEKCKEYNKIQRRTNPMFKLKANLRCRIGTAFKERKYTKTGRTQEILGVDYETAKKHIERQFTKGMSWENYGEWHIDHIYPLYLAKDEAEMVKLFHYTNLRPLWAKENMNKAAKLIEHQMHLPI